MTRTDREEAAAMTQDGYEFSNGMVMTLARITDITARPEMFIRFRTTAPLIARMHPQGLAPVFKLFAARTTTSPITLPTFDDQRLALPSWESDPSRPIVRAYTALHFTPGDDVITFDALDLHSPNSWIHRAQVGDTVGVIGFKHELVLKPTIKRAILLGDPSAQPAIDEIIRSAPDDLPIEYIHLNDPLANQADVTASMQVAISEVPTKTVVWIAGEVHSVAAARDTALGLGVPVTNINSQPYWHRGLSRERYDRILYRRYQQATLNGYSLSDPTVVAKIDLTPAADTEQAASS